MGLSVASLNPISGYTYVSPKQQAYSIENQSSISSAYRESLGNTASPEAVKGPAPVVYTNTRYDVNSVGSFDAVRRANQGYNKIAESFGGIDTMYNRNGNGQGYETLGRVIDAFA